MTDLRLDPILKWTAEEWAEESDRMADWALERMVNRFDVWGQYSVRNDQLGPTVTAVTLPVSELRGGQDMVSFDKLKRHFVGKKAGDLIGLHCISEQETCKWFAIDLDVHTPQESSYLSAVNFNAMRNWMELFRSHLLDPRIIDSNGMGSFHLLVLLNQAYPLADVFLYLEDCCQNYRQLELVRKPELFPSSPTLKKLGKWLRLPGRHHTHQHFSKVWSDEIESCWLEGAEAIESLINIVPMPLPNYVGGTTQKTRDIEKKSVKKTSVCVDLDCVLANYNGWKGIDIIGDPIVGSREFLQALSRTYQVIIYTSRFNNERIKSDNDIHRLKIIIENWFRNNSLHFDLIYTGVGKPLAFAFIDDRAIQCRPLENPQAFAQVLDHLTKF